MQRYEGGFTLYGPKTLEAYVQTMVGLAEEMASGAAPPPPVATPPDLLPRQFSLLAPPGPDGVPPGAAFGEAVVDAAGAYRRGEVVEVSFRWVASLPLPCLHFTAAAACVVRLRFGGGTQ